MGSAKNAGAPIIQPYSGLYDMAGKGSAYNNVGAPWDTPGANSTYTTGFKPKNRA